MADSVRTSRFAPLPLEAPLGAVCRHARRLASLRAALAATLGMPDGSHLAGVSLSSERLTVYADSPAWCTRLRFRAPAIEDTAERHIGRRLRLVFRTQPGTFRNPVPSQTPVSPRAASVLRSAARSINDPALAAALRRLADAQPATGPQAGPA